ncbi:MAG: phosphonate ABC transporter, permease protein PhnE [Neomegalonema sp.]|nr:phosphonate ABC transporter, permease protein PhnE [Neomegalonema sp.]
MSISEMEKEIVALEKQRRAYSLLLIGFTIFLLVLSLLRAEAGNSGDLYKGLIKFFEVPGEVVAGAYAEGWAFWSLAKKYIPSLLETINIAIVSTLIGSVMAVILSLGSTRNLGVWPPLVPVTRRLMDIFRAFPEIVLALLLIVIFGANALPAVIAVTIHTSGALGKLFSEVNENIDQKPIDGLRAAGGGWLQRIRYAVLPQVGPNYLSYILLRLEINVRASAVLGYVGAGGLGADLLENWSFGTGRQDDIAMILLLLITSIVIIDQLSSYLRGRLVGAHSHG